MKNDNAKLKTSDSLQDFDRWNELKKSTDASDHQRMFFPKEREVWMCSIGKNIGFEQNGGGDNFSRPILVIKKFNNQMFWIAPLSTKQKKFDFYYNFTDPHHQKVAVIVAQLRLISVKRFNRKMYEMTMNDFLNTRDIVKQFLVSEQIETPR